MLKAPRTQKLNKLNFEKSTIMPGFANHVTYMYVREALNTLFSYHFLCSPKF